MQDDYIVSNFKCSFFVSNFTYMYLLRKPL